MKSPKLFASLAVILGILSFKISQLSANGANAATPQTIKAASCNTSDIQRALKQAHDGDTVAIPAGTCVWTEGITYTVPGTLTIMGGGSQTMVGGGDATIIVDNISRTKNDVPGLAITTVQGKPFRLSSITFQGSGNDNARTYNGSVRIIGFSHEVRVDHVHFNFVDSLAMKFSGWVYGVVDHSLADHRHNVIDVSHATWNNKSFGDGSWADESHFGSGQFIFFEDNVFNGGTGRADLNGSYSNDCDTGGRFVFRHNTFNGAAVMNHEMEGRKRGCRAFEIYQNTFNSSPTSPLTYATFLRTGTGLIWGNSYTGYVQVVAAITDRAGTVNGDWGKSQWGYCGFKLGPSKWDGNTDSTGYPCLDQLGRGAGELLSNPFPGVVNTVSRNVSWPHQTQEPVYFWNNSYNPPPNVAQDHIWANHAFVTIENRDYFLQLPNYDEPKRNFDGSAGVGQGPLAVRPASCTPLVGYWATDTNTLYQCSAKNTWTVYYTPYPYPHPLQASLNGPARLKVIPVH